jgi:DNA-binding NarL/FixJ family response regulator
MDIAMPLLNGLEATRQILAATPGTKVLILSAHSDDAYIDRVIAVGAVGIPHQADLGPDPGQRPSTR